MVKICLLVVLAFMLSTCKKDKTPSLILDGNREILVGEWEWKSSYCKILINDNWNKKKEISRELVDKTFFTMNHHISIKKNGNIKAYLNNKLIFDKTFTKVLYEIYDGNEAYLFLFKSNIKDEKMGFCVININSEWQLKSDHKFLQFPEGTCPKLYSVVSHNYIKK